MSGPRMTRELEGGHLRATDGPEAVVERGEPVGGRGVPEAGPQRLAGRVVQPAVARDGRDDLADAVVGQAAVRAYVAALRARCACGRAIRQATTTPRHPAELSRSLDGSRRSPGHTG